MPFSRNASIAGQLDHAARPRNVADGFGEEGGIFGCFVDTGLKVLGAVFVGLQGYWGQISIKCR